jgi:hypothetical protein
MVRFSVLSSRRHPHPPTVDLLSSSVGMDDTNSHNCYFFRLAYDTHHGGHECVFGVPSSLQAKYLFRRFRNRENNTIAAISVEYIGPSQLTKYFYIGNQKSFTRLTHRFPHFCISLNSCGHPEYS